MFQFATGYIVSHQNQSRLMVDKGLYNSPKKNRNHTPRKFELDIFCHSFKEATPRDIMRFTNLSPFHKLLKKLNLNFPKIYREKSFGWDENLYKQTLPLYLVGYFQSFKYFGDDYDLIETLFQFPVDSLSKKEEAVKREIHNSNSVSLHIRRGDYAEDKRTNEYHGLCSKTYYLDALERLHEEENELKLFFFSDDMDWVKKEFDYLEFPKEYITNNSGRPAWVDMFLMSECKHNIIANSSYSWWSAYLNKNRSKKIFAPKKWFVNQELNSQTEDLIPTSWCRL